MKLHSECNSSIWFGRLSKHIRRVAAIERFDNVMRSFLDPQIYLCS